MREFFRGWKRKVGCVTLVLACVFMVGWVRSIDIEDGIFVRVADHKNVSLESGEHCVSFAIVYRDDPQWDNRPIYWSRFSFIEHPDMRSRYQRLQSFRFVGFGYVDRRGPSWTLRRLTFPYWSLVIPLTLLSAWLLLSKPQAGSEILSQDIDHE